MKKIKILPFLISAVLCIALLTACGGGSGKSTAKDENSSVTLTDMKGREITLPAPAKRVVALTASDCEIIYALGAGDTIAARGTYCDWPSEILSVPDIGSGNETNVEQILALKPDAVFMNTMNQTLEQVEQLENAGIPVIACEAANIAGVYEGIGIIGAALGKDAEAGALVAEMMSVFADLEDKTKDQNGEKTIYFEVSPLEWGLWAAGSGTFMDEVAQILGLTNIFADVDGWAEVSQEQVLSRNPDYILTTAMYFGEGSTPEEEILSREGWQSVAAVQNGAVFNLGNDELTRPGPRLAQGSQELYEMIYES